MRLPDDYEDHGGGLTPTVISAIVAVTIFVAVILTVVLIMNRQPTSHQQNNTAAQTENVQQAENNQTDKYPDTQDLITGSTLTPSDLDFWDMYPETTATPLPSAEPSQKDNKKETTEADPSTDGKHTLVTIEQGGASRAITTMGNGRLDAVSNAIKTYFGITYELSVYEEHAISRGSNSKAATYVGIVHDGKFYWGVGVDEDIIKSSIAALVSAVNKLAAEQHITSGREERIVEIISFIQKNYVDVTLDMLVDTFHLSKPYLSKYIKEKAGMTFQEVVREERMKKARMLLKETNQTVETIAANVGYENVEHFNRLFKKAYDMTPVQYRKQSAE